MMSQIVITLMETIIDIFINNNDLNSRNNHHYKIGNNQSPNNDERMVELVNKNEAFTN